MNILEVNELCVQYGLIQAVKGVSFTIEQGSIVSLIGANGAGKTTILHTLSGLLNPKSGTMSYQGKSINLLAADKIVGLGLKI